jgi:hypothetical protein
MAVPTGNLSRNGFLTAMNSDVYPLTGKSGPLRRPAEVEDFHIGI